MLLLLYAGEKEKVVSVESVEGYLQGITGMRLWALAPDEVGIMV